jgi:Uma2 family endonuclease
VIVLGTTRQIEVYRRPEGDRYSGVALVSPEDAINSAGIPGVRLTVADLFP